MFEVRFHGRGGQGVVAAAEILSLAAFDQGSYAQAFPSFGSERMGAPVVSFCRIADAQIRTHEPIARPDALIIQDATLISQIDLFAGLDPDTFVVINTARPLAELGLDEVLAGHRAERLLCCPATELALTHIGHPFPNAVLLGAFAALTGQISLDSLGVALAERFSAVLAAKNLAAATAAYALVRPEGGPTERMMDNDRWDSLLERDWSEEWETLAEAPELVSQSKTLSNTLRHIEGSRAVAETVALCRPEVICAYPISPQTHIIEDLGAMVAEERLSPCEYINVESEFSAMSVCIGASAAGARAYTATSSQGLLFMIEAVYNASGLGLPIVMTLANRAIGAPINIWNDHSDAMAVRDAGWIQLFAETNQEAADLHIVAFRLAEALSLPVMVCMDGFILTHAVEQVELASQAQVDTFLSPYEPRQVLDPALPVSIGAMVGPEAFEEVRYLAHLRQRDALALLPTLADEFEACFGRPIGSLVTPYRCESAETIVVAMGSVLGTIKDAVDELCGEGVSIGALGITSFRPFPSAALSAALAGAARVVVLEKAFSVGFGGVLATDTAMALKDQPVTLTNIVAGLGGRPITKASLVSALAEAARGDSESLTFLDLDTELVEHERSHMDTIRQSGPIAENLLKELDTRHPAPAEYPAVPVSFTSTRPSATTSPREQT